MTKEIIGKVAENMLKTRPRKEVVYRPFIKNEAVTRRPLSTVDVDLRKIYPQAADGDTAKVKTILKIPYPNSVILGFWGARAFLNQKEVFADHDGYVQIRLEGEDELEFICKKKTEHFGVSFVLSTVHYRGMWASDYLYWINYTLPQPEYRGEEGVAISALNRDEYIFPQSGSDSIDFARLYPEGGYAFAASYALYDTFYTGEGEAFVDGHPYDGGVIRAGSSIIVRSKVEDNPMLNTGADGGFGIPILETSRKNGTRWLLLGAFDRDELPELQFKKPYDGSFWRLCDGAYVRPYLDTSFFGKWFYALMVGQYGILKAARLLGEEYKQYFTEGIEILADYFELMQYENQTFGAPSFLERSTMLWELDPIGTIGMNLCELYQIKPTESVRKVIDVLLEAMENRVPRFSDGTFRRNKTMWADDTFMSLPFLARVGRIRKDGKYDQICIEQLSGFCKRLYMPEKKLFSHIYFIEDERKNEVAWGRGNGWVFLTISEVLEHIPEDTPGREQLIALFAEFAEGLAAVQDRIGLWHQVLDMPQSYEETSCSGMFALGMIRGVKNRWLSEKYCKNIKRAIRAIVERCIDAEGNILGVCKGSGFSYDPKYYAQLGTVTNDDHDTGIILAALAEYEELQLR